MNTWGKVGQFEKRGRCWRYSGSLSTSTLWNCAPTADSACAVRIEKPHWGNCGVPFMNSTTRWVVIRF